MAQTMVPIIFQKKNMESIDKVDIENSNKLDIENINKLDIENKVKQSPITKEMMKDAFIFIFLTANIISFSIMSNTKNGYTFSLVLYILISLHLITKHFTFKSKSIFSKDLFMNTKYSNKIINMNTTIKKYWAVIAIILFAILMISTGMFTEINERTSLQSRGQCLVGIVFFLVIMVGTSKGILY